MPWPQTQIQKSIAGCSYNAKNPRDLSLSGSKSLGPACTSARLPDRRKRPIFDCSQGECTLLSSRSQERRPHPIHTSSSTHRVHYIIRPGSLRRGCTKGWLADGYCLAPDRSRHWSSISDSLSMTRPYKCRTSSRCSFSSPWNVFRMNLHRSTCETHLTLLVLPMAVEHDGWTKDFTGLK